MLPALLGLASSAYQFYQGQQQEDAAKKLKPSNYIPPAIQEATDSARMRANNSVMPGYARGLDRLRTSTANTIYNTGKATTNPNVVQQSVADSDAREKEVMKDMAVSNAAYRTQNQDKLNQLLGVEGQYQKDAWDSYNGTKSALVGAGMRNKYNSLSSLAEGAIWNPESFKLPKINFSQLFRKRISQSAGGSGSGAGGNGYELPSDVTYYN